MERRKILLGSGTAFATVLAGCASSINQKSKTQTDDEKDDKNDTKDNKKGEKTEKNEKKDNKQDNKKNDKNNEKKEIPGFDRDAFQIDSDVIKVKEVTYRKQKLNVRVMLLTDDRDELAEELRALAPGLARGIRDAEEFLAELKEIKFTLLDEHKNRVFAFFLDVAWLREFLDGDITNDEFVNRILDAMVQL
ncbi:hypothetical protein [Natronococcus wangiae]|uniref:hypothetical protein n=1 Tax=Natronococcus wangiae TaxID=3068275 RepID=UPI00273EF5F2|nr:hypothetical protein [Natronococcus sp. AD5]